MTTTISHETDLFQEPTEPKKDGKLKKILKIIQHSIKYDTAVASGIIEVKYLNHGFLWDLPNELFLGYHASLVIIGGLSAFASEGKSFVKWNRKHRLRSVGRTAMKVVKEVVKWLLIQDITTQAVQDYIRKESLLTYLNWVREKYPPVGALGEPIIPSIPLPRYLFLLAGIVSALELAEHYPGIKTNIMSLYNNVKKDIDYLTERTEGYMPEGLISVGTKLKNKVFPYTPKV